MQQVGLCHRSISMDTLKVDGDRLTIDDLGWCIRVSPDNSSSTDGPLPTPGGTTPQFVAPEYFSRTTDVEWDYFAADLWSCGLVLFSMVAGTGSLFSAPIQEDKVFKELCVSGHIQEHIQRLNASQEGTNIQLSLGLIDLLKRMLSADPAARPSLEDVMGHSWVKDGESVPPSKWKTPS